MNPTKPKSARTQLLLAVVAGAAICTLSLTNFYQDLESSSYDFRFLLRNQWFGPPPQLPAIATIDIDDLALQSHGFPFSRDLHADLVRVLQRYGARMIGFDIFFYEPSGRRLSPEEVEALQGASVSKEQVLGLVRNDDEEFLDAARASGIVYLAQTFEIAEQGHAFARENLRKRSEAKSAAVEALGAFSVPIRSDQAGLFYHTVDIDVPLIDFIRSARGVGFALPKPDHDGIVRRYRMALVYDGRAYFSLSLLMACHYLGVPLDRVVFRHGAIVLPGARFPDGSVTDLTIPVSGRAEMLVNWAGSFKDSYRHLPYDLVIDFAQTEPQNRALRFAKAVRAQRPDITDDDAYLRTAAESGVGDLPPELLLEYRGVVSDCAMMEEALEREPDLRVETLLSRMGVPDADAPAVAEVLGPYFGRIRTNLRIASILLGQSELPLEEVGQRMGVSRLEDISLGVGILRSLVRGGGIRPEDRPLFFLDRLASAGLHGLASADRTVSRADFDGTVFFYGLTATGTHDLNPTPFGAREAMVGAHANVFNTVLTRNFLRRVPLWGNALIMLALGVLIGVLVPRFRAVPGAAVVGAIQGVYLVVAFFAFTRAGLWIDVVGPVATLVIGYLTITLFNYVQKEKEKEFVQGAFGHYLDPKVVDQLVENPELVNQLGGDQRVMTVYFSDVASFSTISENLTPVELVETLNEYLTEMCEVIAQHNGTIDKFEGDAIMAFWGAPFYLEDHARCAVLAAVGMQKKCAELRRRWEEAGRMTDLRRLWNEQGRGEFFRVRMGINTAEMVVGNMGSHTRVDYTVMGDGVNLASRLEGAGKAYNITTMISEDTLRAAGEGVVDVRPLDSIRVVGKDEPVRVYEVLGRKGETAASKLEVVDLYVKGYGYYAQRKWEEAIALFEAGLKIDPADGPCGVFIKRCRAFQAAPPPETWDAVHSLESK